MAEVDAAGPQRMDPVEIRLAAGDELVHVVRDVAAEDDEAVLGLDEHALVPRRVARREEHRDPVEELGVAVELPVVGALEARPLDQVVGLGDRGELGPLDVGRAARRSAGCRRSGRSGGAC